MDDVAIAGARRELALACRILAHRRLSDDVLGHVSQRLDGERLLVRCRGPHELGLRFTTADDIRVVSLLDGRVLDDPDGAGGWQPPSELPIHTELLRHRPEVGCVLHAHPRPVVAASLAELPLLPIVGAFDMPAMRLAERGIATFHRSVLVRRAGLAHELLAAMGDAEACVLVGHGLVTVGATVPEAVLRALAVDSLARLSLDVAAAGGRLRSIPGRDAAELPDLGTAFTTDLLWRHHVACLDADGWGPGGEGTAP